MGKTKIKKIDDSVQEPIKEVPVEMETQEATIGEQNSEPKTQKEKVSKRAAKKITPKPKIRGKKYQEKATKVNSTEKYSVMDAVKLAQSSSYSEFKGTIEAHINTNAKNLRGLVNMPFAQGKKLRILAFGSSKSPGSGDLEGVVWGNDEAISQIEAGKINFDIVVTTPPWMPKLAKVAKILGPRSLMPNPKNGTISENLDKAITELQAGKTEYKTETNGQVIHLAIGKVDQNPEEIMANLKVIYNTVGRSKIKKISLSPTMGPAVRVDLATLN